MLGSSLTILLAATLAGPPGSQGATAPETRRMDDIAALLRQGADPTAVEDALRPVLASPPPDAARRLLIELQSVPEFRERRRFCEICRVVARAIADLDEATGVGLLRDQIAAEAVTNPEWVANLAIALVHEDAPGRPAPVKTATHLAALADQWLGIAERLQGIEERPDFLRWADVRLGSALLVALTLADYGQARPRLARAERLELPSGTLEKAVAAQGRGNREAARFFLARGSAGIDDYLATAAVLSEAEPMLVGALAGCPKQRGMWSRRCAEVGRQLEILDSPAARKALARIEREPTEAELLTKQEEEYERQETTKRLKVGLPILGAAALLSSLGGWQIAAWRNAAQPGSARTPLVTINAGLTSGFVLGTTLFLTPLILSSHDRDGFGVALLAVFGGLAGVAVGGAAGAGIGYWQRDNRAFYQTIAISQIVWPLLAGAFMYALQRR